MKNCPCGLRVSVKILLDNMPMRRGMRVLGLACGSGFPLLEPAQRLDTASKLTTLDPWAAAAVQRAHWKKSQIHQASPRWG